MSYEVEHQLDRNRFIIKLDNEAEAELLYERLSEGVLDMHYTGVPSQYRGHGIAKLLAQAAFDYTVSSNLKMKLTCTYLQKYASENQKPEYQGRIVPLS